MSISKNRIKTQIFTLVTGVLTLIGFINTLLFNSFESEKYGEAFDTRNFWAFLFIKVLPVIIIAALFVIGIVGLVAKRPIVNTVFAAVMAAACLSAVLWSVLYIYFFFQLRLTDEYRMATATPEWQLLFNRYMIHFIIGAVAGLLTIAFSFVTLKVHGSEFTDYRPVKKSVSVLTLLSGGLSAWFYVLNIIDLIQSFAESNNNKRTMDPMFYSQNEIDYYNKGQGLLLAFTVAFFVIFVVLALLCVNSTVMGAKNLIRKNASPKSTKNALIGSLFAGVFICIFQIGINMERTLHGSSPFMFSKNSMENVFGYIFFFALISGTICSLVGLFLLFNAGRFPEKSNQYTNQANYIPNYYDVPPQGGYRQNSLYTGGADRFCTACGKPLKEGAKFCGSCGAQIRE